MYHIASLSAGNLHFLIGVFLHFITGADKLEIGRIEKRYNAALGHYNALEAERDKRLRKSRELDAFMAMLAKQPLVVSEWDERLWVTLLDRATVYRDGRISFRVKSGKEMSI